MSRPRGDLPGEWPALRQDASLGGITFFLGAGVSLARGVPSWEQLVREVCAETGYDIRAHDWLDDSPQTQQALEQARRLLRDELPDAGGNVTASLPPPPHPLAWQIILEEIEVALQRQCKHADNPIAAAQQQFARLLAKRLYANLRHSDDDSLATLASILRADQRRPIRRVRRVITLNADDLLERCLNEGHDPARDPVAWPIVRASHHPRRDGANGRSAIPVYHVHGYLPHDRPKRGAGDGLVFTDAQYWESQASPSSFANRVVGNALHDSHCVFVGLSMTDLNLMRWLGLHAGEVAQDKLSEFHWSQKRMDSLARAIRKTINRHFWITTRSADPTGLIRRHLQRRGVVRLLIDDWQQDLRAKLSACFPDD